MVCRLKYTIVRMEIFAKGKETKRDGSFFIGGTLETQMMDVKIQFVAVRTEVPRSASQPRVG